MFTYDTTPKIDDGEKRSCYKTDIGRLLKRPHSTVSTFIRRYLLRCELENRRRSGRPHKITPRDYRKL